MAKRIEKICYQPGVFLTVEHNDLCTKLEVESSVEELHLGEQTSKRKMNFILEKKHGVFPNIKKLVIEPGAAEIFVDNEVFPNVKRVDSRNPQYLSCDRMLVRIKQGAARSLRNVFDLASNMPVNLSMISEIERFALCQCMSTELINTGSLRCVSVNSFEGSAISDMSYDENGTKITGGILVDIDDNADCVSLPGRDANMRAVASGIRFSDVKKTIINDVDFAIRAIIPNLSGIPEMSETIIINDHECKTFREVQTLAKLSGVKNIEFGEKCKGFQSIDGIAYTSSLAYLVACPSDRTKEVVVPDGVRVISNSSFKNCSIVSVKFPDSVVNIEDKAFYNCKSLKHVDFGHGITHIGSASSWNVFASCGLEEADIPEQVTYIGSGAFWACELKKVTFHEGLLKIASDAFGNNVDLKEVTLPDSVIHLGENAFRNTKVVHVHDYLSDIITAAGEPVVFADRGAGYTEIDINGKSVFAPKHMKEGDRRKVKKIIEDWIDGTADDTDKLFGYAITLDEKQDVALKIYESTKSENAKKYLKKHSKNIARRYLEEKRKEELIKFIGFGLLSKQGLQEILDAAKDEADVSAYVLQMMQKKKDYGGQVQTVRDCRLGKSDQPAFCILYMERKKRKEEKNMEKRNVIFLDVDGVLNSLAYHEKAGRNAPELEERALRILADIYKENDCCIVLASSWRELAPTEYRAAHSMYQYLLDSLGRYGMEIAGKTPYIQMDRPSEIAKWLEDHRDEVKNFIILDDDFSQKGYARYELDSHLIQTVFFTHDMNEGGLQEKHKEKARKIFSET